MDKSTASLPPSPGTPAFVSNQLLRELRSLNYRFIELLCDESQEQVRLPGELQKRLLELNKTDQVRLATCPYSLYELNLADTPWWQEQLNRTDNLEIKTPHCVHQFTLGALMYAQRLALENSELGCLLLGMSNSVGAIFEQLTIGHLMDCTPIAASRLTVRLINDPNFWPDLVNYVKEESGDKYLAAQTAALQIMAARL